MLDLGRNSPSTRTQNAVAAFALAKGKPLGPGHLREFRPHHVSPVGDQGRMRETLLAQGLAVTAGRTAATAAVSPLRRLFFFPGFSVLATGTPFCDRPKAIVLA